MNLKSEASKSQLNYLWWLLEPALFISVYFVVFDILMNRGTDNFIAFLICGKIPFLWFSRTVLNSSNALVSGAGLMNQINIPKLFFPLVVIGQDLVKTAVVFLMMLCIMWAIGYTPSIEWLAIVPIMLVQLVFVSAVAILFCALIPLLPDLKFIVATFIILMMFGSGIFYDPTQFLLPEHKAFFFLNPLAQLISMYRDVILNGLPLNWYSLYFTFICCFGLLCISVIILRINDAKYPRLVLR
jgi:lipopolysaccharide transport system permease protein